MGIYGAIYVQSGNYSLRFVNETTVCDSLTKLQSANDVERKRINTTYWSKFNIGILFKDKIKKPCVYHTKDVTENPSGIPYIVRSKFNNGVKYRVTAPVQSNPMGVISWGSENATFCYQSEIWCSGRDIYYLDTSNLSEYVCRFLISCLMTITHKYSYSDGLFPELLKQENILLPVTLNGEPDWNYMEQYMRNIEQKTIQTLDSLIS